MFSVDSTQRIGELTLEWAEGPHARGAEVILKTRPVTTLHCETRSGYLVHISGEAVASSPPRMVQIPKERDML
jgi:hypothetical protein